MPSKDGKAKAPSRLLRSCGAATVGAINNFLKRVVQTAQRLTDTLLLLFTIRRKTLYC